jgi:teichuronic acid biosynthesis glycosyltransferase TuaC
MKRLNILVISEVYPNPVDPTSGIYVERQADSLKKYCDQTVVVPTRVFPHLRLWKNTFNSQGFIRSWREWKTNLNRRPRSGEVNEIPMWYTRYTSPPRQGFHGLWGFFAYAFLKQQLKFLHKHHHFDLIHAHHASPCGVIALLAKQWMGIPVTLSVHGSDLTYTVKQRPIGASVIRWVFKTVDAICTNSSWTTTQVVGHGADQNKVKLVRLGGNFQYGPPVELETSPRSKTTLLSVGHLMKSKGHSDVLEAVRGLVDMGYSVEYVIVGNGPERLSLQTQSERLGIERIVHFLGGRPHNEVLDHFASCDIFVLPSWIESFGIVYAEALSLGKPVIGCAGAGGPEDLRALGDCVELVKPRDVPSLVDAIRRLIDDPAKRKRMGNIGSGIVKQYYTWEQNAIDTMEIYQELIERANRDR